MIWRKELKNNITTLEDLEKYIYISDKDRKILADVIELHPMSITRYYMSLIDRDNLNDPLLKMMVPSIDEMNTIGSYDTSGESDNTKLTGLQHKYSQTALILSTNHCTAYCRFCFRKRMVGKSNDEIVSRFREAVSYIREHKEITNVLISGGDPFFLDTRVLKIFLEELKDIEHLEFIRFGTRTPVVFPQRIYEDDELVDYMSHYANTYHKIYVITHFNHSNEITPESKKACSRLRNAGIIVQNQTVLTKGVNDDAAVLAALLSDLVKAGVLPYYVFQCRPVSRVKGHFQLSLKEGYEIVEKAKARLNGHGKGFRFIMSHVTGKIEILGIIEDEIYLKYHQAKNPDNIGRLFKKKLTENAAWLDDLE